MPGGPGPRVAERLPDNIGGANACKSGVVLSDEYASLRLLFEALLVRPGAVLKELAVELSLFMSGIDFLVRNPGGICMPMPVEAGLKKEVLLTRSGLPPLPIVEDECLRVRPESLRRVEGASGGAFLETMTNLSSA